MRDIKFRAWDNVNKEMLENVGVSADGIQIVGEPEWRMFGSTKYHHDVMQFTGLKDKNNKDIYEGDVVICDGRRTFVVWDKAEACFRYQKEFTPNENYVMNYNGDEEVIGNIYQNQELLK
jgi:uncharacterized phage protein (TIGR01671 family)